jgi:hypothetical protein
MGEIPTKENPPVFLREFFSLREGIAFLVLYLLGFRYKNLQQSEVINGEDRY